MYELVLVFCLIRSPTSCQEERPMEQYSTGAACFLEAQVLAAQWLDEHPKWQLDHAICEEPWKRQEHT